MNNQMQHSIKVLNGMTDTHRTPSGRKIRSPLSDEDKRAADIARRRLNGETFKQIAKAHSIAQSSPDNILQWFCKKYCEPNGERFLSDALKNWADRNPVGALNDYR